MNVTSILFYLYDDDDDDDDDDEFQKWDCFLDEFILYCRLNSHLLYVELYILCSGVTELRSMSRRREADNNRRAGLY